LLEIVVGIVVGRAVAMARTAGAESAADRTIQLRTEDPSFPAESRAITRIMMVPEASAGTARVQAPDSPRFRATVSQLYPLSFETPISTPEIPPVSAALQMT
jgi:hypothetical protein